MGGILAAGIAGGYMLSKRAPTLDEDLKEHYDAILKIIKRSLRKLKDVSKEDFTNLVIEVVSDYVDKKKLGMDDKDALIGALQAQWDALEAEYAEDLDE